jgi:leucyl aminopeptidase
MKKMLPCYLTSTSKKSIPITPVIYSEFGKWLAQQNEYIKTCLQNDSFKAEIGGRCLIKDADGKLTRVLLGVENQNDYWSFANLPRCLPQGIFNIDAKFPTEALERAVLAFGLGTYQFTPYKKQLPITAQLEIPKECDSRLIENLVRAIFLVRDLINTPTDDLGPAELAEVAEKLADEFGAKCKQIIGDDLLTAGFPAIHAVGRASIHAPRLIDLRWGNPKHPKIVLVGKGVSFDSGGLDLKSADGMLLMKKDMGGAAHILGIARMVMAMKLPIHLRVLIPAVENAISGDAYHPGDIITTRKGLTVEITNTDAEGRLILCDALAEAAAEKPELIIDFATLTAAANIALGPEIPALFTPQDDLAKDLIECANQEQDLIWRMPLYKPYRRYLESPIADLFNAPMWRFASLITPALFLQQFVDPQIPWAHFDLMAWNPETKFGRIQGGEAMGLRTVFSYLRKRYNADCGK